MASAWEITSPEFTVEGATSTELPGSALPPPIASESGAAVPTISAEDLAPWSGQDRVTVLLLGIDQRCDEEGPTRTDTMMVLTADPVGLSAATLSLPRDLWVDIPGFGVDRVNQAHYLGEVYDYPGGGPVLAVETVEATLGIDIDFYVTVNFDAFVELVDLIDGIDIVNDEDIEDDTYPDNCYGYDPFYLEAGEHHLDGTQALKYARTRVTVGGDVDRATRQQQVILAVREKVMQLNQLPLLLAQAPRLWQTFQRNVHTDMTLEEAIQLALLVPEIPRDSFQTAVINYDYVYTQTTPDGRQVLVPIRENIRSLRDQLFRPPAIPTPVIENLPVLAATEGARVAVYNGTPVFGLAGSTQDYLEGKGINVAEIGNADSAAYRTTQIIDFGSHPNTTRYLTQLLSLPPLNVSNGTEPTGDFDVLVILGNDWEVPTP
jgi:LCP family protein required for cell wall assembly